VCSSDLNHSCIAMLVMTLPCPTALSFLAAYIDEVGRAFAVSRGNGAMQYNGLFLG